MADIKSGCKYPLSSLSNFAGHSFTIDGVQCNSMEGFLQSLKFKNPDMQLNVCLLIGRAAKFKGKKKNWKRTQTLYWRGVAIPRRSQEYQDLLDRAYQAMYDQCKSFRKALHLTNGRLAHSIGKRNEADTVLTQKEFISRLHKLRDE